MKVKLEEGIDYYLENGKVVFTEEYHRKRGYCCGNKCRHCPFTPLHTRGSKFLRSTKSRLIEE